MKKKTYEQPQMEETWTAPAAILAGSIGNGGGISVGDDSSIEQGNDNDLSDTPLF